MRNSTSAVWLLVTLVSAAENQIAQPDQYGITHQTGCRHPQGQETRQLSWNSACEGCNKLIYSREHYWQCYSCPGKSSRTVDIPKCKKCQSMWRCGCFWIQPSLQLAKGAFKTAT
jgi:hypothetical protein